MGSENKTSQNDIETFVEDKLTKVENNICALVAREYPELKIMVSIQVLHSSQTNYRNPPCNKKCDAVQRDPDMLERCDRSDDAMKIILWHQIMGRHTPGAEMKGIGYHCHQKLSNLVMPIHVGLLKKTWYWYIFLGQFYLKKCSKVSMDRGCPDGFASEKIEILSKEHIPEMFSDCIQAGFFCDDKEFSKAETLNVSSFTIPQLLICRYIALSYFRHFLRTLKGDEQEKFKKWLKKYAKPKNKDYRKMKSAAID